MAPAGPLRVAVVARAVAPLHGVGGLERSVGDLVRHLAARGVAVTLITPPPRAAIAPAAHDPFASPLITMRQVPYLTFPMANRRGTTVLDRSSSYLLYGERAGRAAGALVDRREVDLVHGFGASVLGYARRKARPAPLVLNPQGLEEFGATLPRMPWGKRLGYAPLRWAVRRAARAADAILATDAALEPMVVRHLAPAPDQVRVIPNGVDLTAIASLAGQADGPRIRQRYGLGTGDFVILSAGRLEQNKGLDVLAAALGLATQPTAPLAGVPWRWVVVGAGPQRRSLEADVAAAGIGDRVVWTGRASDADLHAWYEGADLFVHPTRYEGSSLVTLEAMAHRLPVVATRAGGLPDKVRPGVNGWLVDPDDAGALAGAVSEAAGARESLRAMGAAGRAIVEQEFSWARIADAHIALYEALLAARVTSR